MLLCTALALTSLVACSSQGRADARSASPSPAVPASVSATGSPAPSTDPLTTPSAAPVEARSALRAAPLRAAPQPPAVVRRGTGVLAVVPGASAVAGTGRPTRYLVEVEGGLGVDPRAFAREVERVLGDRRSWGAGGRRAMQRVSGGTVAFRVALASPRTTDRLCSPLRTNGYYSCANSGRAVLNLARWVTGAPSYAGRLTEYRQYLVNHEVGHTLGRGHERCPGPGRPAPVMLQQTKGLAGCARNSWPYP